MRTIFVCALAVAGVAGLGEPVTAQDTTSTGLVERAWDFKLFPRLGYHATDKSLGLGTDGKRFGVSGSMTMGVSAQMTTPVRWLDLRLVYDRTVGADLVERVFIGDQPCGFRCSQGVEADLGTGFGAAVETGAIDAVIRPWRDGPVAPYAFGGVGFKRYALANETTDPPTVYGYHFGLGVDLTLGPLELQIEAGNTMTGSALHSFGNPFGDFSQLPLSQQAFRGIRHDLVTSVGVKFKRWPFEQ